MKHRSPLTAIRAAVGFFVVGAAVVLSATTASASDETHLLDAIKRANPLLFADQGPLRGPDGANAIDLPRVSSQLPRLANEGVEISRPDGATLIVGLPFADRASAAIDLGGGAIGFDNQNGSVTVPIESQDGSVAIHAIIESELSPTTYDFTLDLPEGATIRTSELGEIFIVDEQGSTVFFVAPAWAIDALGKKVPTHFEVRGDTLSQVVEHSADYSYPIVADPSIGGFYMASYSWNAARDRLTLWPTFAGGTFPSGTVYSFGWPEVTGATSGTNLTMNQQFGCHAIGNLALWAAGQTWDLEAWRSVISNPLSMFSMPYPCNW